MLFSTDTVRKGLCFRKNKVKLEMVILENLKCFNVEIILVVNSVSRTPDSRCCSILLKDTVKLFDKG